MGGHLGILATTAYNKEDLLTLMKGLEIRVLALPIQQNALHRTGGQYYLSD